MDNGHAGSICGKGVGSGVVLLLPYRYMQQPSVCLARVPQSTNKVCSGKPPLAPGWRTYMAFYKVRGNEMV